MQPAPKPVPEAENPLKKNVSERALRVEKIRAEVQAGTYKVDSKRVAEAIVKRHIVS
jgi:anti-sigma28 factor (negative regulator of flagellin synthesis)